MSAVLAWHFVGKTLRDGRPIPPDGEWLVHRRRVVPCKRGLHASECLIDALKYAPGATLCRVECAGTVKRDGDKLACSRRRILWRMDASDVLRRFARQCALDVAHLWDMPYVVVKYLSTGDETLRDAAHAAASAAAHAATHSAEYGAARAADAAALATTHSAASAAAREAASAAAREAASAAARAASAAALATASVPAWNIEFVTAMKDARAAQNERLVAMVEAERAR